MTDRARSGSKSANLPTIGPREVQQATRSRWIYVRLGLLAGAMVLCFGSLATRAYVLQVQKRDLYRSLAEEQYLREVELPPYRGRIFDSIGTELAASANVDSVYIEPAKLRAEIATPERREQLATQLSQALHLERSDVVKRLATEKQFVFLKRRLLPDEAQRVRDLGVPGLRMTQEPKRYYPNRGLAGPVLGWAGVDATGLEGVELAYDRFLRGSRSSILGLQDARGRKVMVGGVGEVARDHGHDVYLTLDKFIQFRLEKALEEGVLAAHAKAGVAVALDPRNGDVVAMASVPSVNPNDPSGARERGVRNRAVTDPFEPGSTVKPFTIAAAIEAGVVRATDEWDCEGGSWRVGHNIIHDADPEGILTTSQVLARSSNIGTSKITRRLGKEKMFLMLRQMGFFAPSGIDLPGERAGQVRPVAEWGDVAFANISFGQGMTATPLQLAAAMAVFANGGTLYRPRILQKVVSPSGQVVLQSQPDGHRVISAHTASVMRQMLRAVMLKKGTGETLDILGYPVAGKTGTAQKVDPATRRYSPEHWASSFIGFAPVDDPRLLLLVMVDEPQDGHYGSAVAGPIFFKVMSAALPYLGVPPRPPRPGEVVGSAVAQQLAQQPTPVVPVALDPGQPPPPPLLPPRDNTSGERVPDFTGLGLGRALLLAQKAGLRLEISGSGHVVSQEPQPGSVRRGIVCQLRLAPTL